MFYGYEKTFQSIEHLEQAIVDYINYYNNKRIKIKLKPQRQVLLANLVTFVDFTLPIKSMLLSVLTSDTMNLETFQPRNISPNVGIPMPERFSLSAFITQFQLATPILVILQTSMRNGKDNRKRFQPNHTRLPLYIVSSEQCITS